MDSHEKDWFELQSDDELTLCIKYAMLETEKWIRDVTGKEFKYPDDPRRSLQNGVLLCELLNGLRPETIGKINRLPTPIAGIDNLNVFLQCCNKHFGLKDSQLFAPGDLEDLSNRAFADSEDQLRAEAERRIRNVLITIYWLGRKAQDCCKGPPLEFTAFAPLLGNLGYLPSNLLPPQRCLSPTSSVASSNKDNLGKSSDYSEERFGARAVDIVNQRNEIQHSITSEEILAESRHKREISGDSVDHSSAYGSFLSGPKTSQSSDFIEDGVLHSRDDSYDSLLSDGAGHVEYHTVDTSQSAMPVRHKSSPSSNKEFRYSATFDGVYDHKDSMDMEYGGSTGNLSHASSVDEYNRFRFSDSAPHNSSQGSLDSGGPKSPKFHPNTEFVPSTRAPERKTSTPAYDPLQFIKGNKSNPLAEKAKTTVKVMKQQKEQKKVAQIEDADWQSNLSNWKSKMRRKSAVECKKVTVFEEVEKQLEEESQATKKKNKTFKEMMEDRQQRKGGITSSYPMDDDDNVFKTSPRTQQKDDEMLQSLRGYSQEDDSYLTSNIEKTETFEFSKSLDTGLNRDNGFTDTTYGITRQYTQPEQQEQKTRPLDRLKARSSNSPENRWSWHADRFGQGDSLTPWADSSDNRTPPREKSPARPTPGKLANLSRFEASTDTKPVRELSPLRRGTQQEREQAAGFKNKLQMFEAKHEDTSFVSTHSKTDRGLSPTRKIGSVNVPQTSAFQSKPSGAYESKFSSRTDSARANFATQNTSTYQSSRTETTYQKHLPESDLANLNTKQYDMPSWKEKLKEEPIKSSFAEVSKSSVSSEEAKNVIEKTIKITQNPGSNKGFGFHIKGGKENGLPITVQKVSLGSAADVCELQAGDEVVSVNGAEVANHYLESVKLVLSQAARIGQVELVIKRSISQDPLLEDSFEQEEQMRLSQSQKFFSTHHEPSMSPTPENQEEDLEERYEEPQHDVGLHPREEQMDERAESPGVSEASVDSQEERKRQAQLEEEERERLDRLYAHTFDQPPKSWEAPLEPAFEPYKPEPPPEIPQQLSPQPQIQPQSFQHHQAPPNKETTQEEEDEDAPPPLPTAPPPMPNWNTFPGQAPTSSDMSFFDASDLLPDTAMTPVKEDPLEDRPVRMERSGSIDDLDEVTQKKLETVRRKSAFLGLNVYETEEYKKIKEGDYKYSDGVDLQSQEEEIIANLEREEREKRDTSQPDLVQAAPTQWHTSRFEPHEVDIESKMSKDIESVKLNTRPEDRLSNKYFNQEEEMKRMKRYQEEQDRLREEKYEREQELLRKQHDEDMKRVRQIEEEKRRQEESMLEKERKWQQEMEEKKRKLEEERQRLEEERIVMEKESQLRMQREEQTRQDTGYQSRFPWQSLPNEVDKDRIRREEEEILAERDRERERREEERRKREEKEAELMKEKEEQLKAMEDRIAREAEQIRIERDRLEAEKQEQRKKWNLQTEKVSQSSLQTYSSQPKYTPAYGGGITQVVTTTMAPTYQKGQFEYVYRAEHSPPEKLQPEFERPVESVPRETVPVAREVVPVAREPVPVAREPVPVARQPVPVAREPVPVAREAVPVAREAMPVTRDRVVSIERKEETLVSRSPFGSTSSLNDPLKRGTPQSSRKGLPIQPKPNIKSELMNKPPSPIPTLRSSPALAKPNPPPSPTTRVSDGAAIQMDRRSLHQLNQVPRPRLNENWVNPDAGKKNSAPRRSEVMRQTTPTAQHWVVEEAERRRLAEQSGKERLQKLQSRQQQQGLVQSNEPNAPQANYYSHPASRDFVNMTPASEAEPYIAALRQAGVYASASISGSQQSLHSVRDSPPKSVTYPRTTQPKYPVGLYNEDTGYPANYQPPTSPEIKAGYYGGTTNPRPARPIPEAIKQTLLDRVNSPKSVRYNSSPQLSQPMSHTSPTQPFPAQSLSQSHQFISSQHGPSSPAYAYPHQVKTLSSPYHVSQSHGSVNQSASGASQPYNSSSQSYASQPLSQPYNSNQPHMSSSNNSQQYHSSNHPFANSSQQYGSNQSFNSYNGNYHNMSQPYSQYNPAPAKPPRTFENDVQLSAEKAYNTYPTPYGSSPNANPAPFYSPKSAQPQNYKHMSPNERSASDSSESAPPKSAQLLQPQEETIAEQIVSVAGHQRCAHCETELGQGAAMIIESLQLYYHVHCFRCCVCCAPLGTGERGADVRVRLNKLHCQNCYSNDEAGLKYSRV